MEERLVLFGQAGSHLQGVPGVAVLQEEAGVVIHKAEDPEEAPLQDVGQLMGQELLCQADAPFHQDDSSPDLGSGPGGDQPGDIDDSNGDVRGSSQDGLSFQSFLRAKPAGKLLGEDLPHWPSRVQPGGGEQCQWRKGGPGYMLIRNFC